MLPSIYTNYTHSLHFSSQALLSFIAGIIIENILCIDYMNKEKQKKVDD